MQRDDVGLVYRIVKEAIDELRVELAAKEIVTKEVNQFKPVDVDEIVKLVLDKIKIISTSAETPTPLKKGKKED